MKFIIEYLSIPVLTIPLLACIPLIAIVSYLVTRWFIRYAISRRHTDIPNKRSSHVVPTPKGGGVGFVGVTVTSIAVYFILSGFQDPAVPFLFLGILVLIACLGWFDDLYDLSKRVRFGIQSVAAVTAILFISNLDRIYVPFAGFTDPGLLGGVVAFIWITGTANIYNFMDGIDGIASVQAIVASAGWLLFAWILGAPVLFTINLFLITSVAVFLHFNWSPARIFMGDVGSLFLGYAFAVMPFFAGWESDSVAAGQTIWLAGLLLWPFLFDGSYTIFRRLSREENIFKAHRSHLYQRLNITGWSHNRISILYLLFALFCLGVAVGYFYSPDWARAVILILLSLLSAFYVIFVKSTEKRERTRPAGNGQNS